MITIEKLDIYKKYQGDGDAFCRVGKKEEKSTINYSDWKRIEEFLQDISIVKNGYASKPFEVELKEILNISCENQKVINALWNM